jgi:hypothetical protein
VSIPLSAHFFSMIVLRRPDVGRQKEKGKNKKAKGKNERKF